MPGLAATPKCSQLGARRIPEATALAIRSKCFGARQRRGKA